MGNVRGLDCCVLLGDENLTRAGERPNPVDGELFVAALLAAATGSKASLCCLGFRPRFRELIGRSYLVDIFQVNEVELPSFGDIQNDATKRIQGGAEVETDGWIGVGLLSMRNWGLSCVKRIIRKIRI